MVSINYEASRSAPPSSELRIEVERRQGVCYLRCVGRLVGGADPEYLRVKSEEIKKLNCGKILADFKDVPQIGSSGLSFIVSLYASILRNPEGRFVLAGVHPRVREILDLTRLSSVIPLAQNVDEALESLME